MNRSELRQQVRFLSLVEAHEIDDGQLNILLDEAYSVVESRRTWPWAVVTKPAKIETQMGVEEYAIPDFSHVVTIVDLETNDQLRSVSSQDLAMNAWEQYAVPQVYTVEANKITLSPIPDKDGRMYDVVYTRLKNWPCDEDIPPFEVQFHTVLVDWALHRVWEREEDFRKSDDYRARFETRLADMIGFYNSRTKDRPLIYGVHSPHVSAPLFPARDQGFTIKEFTG